MEVDVGLWSSLESTGEGMERNWCGGQTSCSSWLDRCFQDKVGTCWHD